MESSFTAFLNSSSFENGFWLVIGCVHGLNKVTAIHLNEFHIFFNQLTLNINLEASL